MRYHGSIIRPPSEAESLILQVTYGCSHGDCTFCSTYLDKPFQVRPFEEVREDVATLPAYLKRDVRKVFLADGDALVLPSRRMRELLELLSRELPHMERVSCYATTQNLQRRTKEDLVSFRERGLELLYLGLESGDDATLEACAKGVTGQEQIDACCKARDAGIALSLTTVLGLAGREGSLRHARATGEALSAIDPEYIGVLSLMVVDGTPLAEEVRSGRFEVPDSLEMLAELREIIAATDVSGALFRSNHASNYLPVKGRLPDDKEEMLRAIDEVLRDPDPSRLRPESWRGL